MKFYISNGEVRTTIYDVVLFINNEPAFHEYFFTMRGAQKFYDSVMETYKSRREEFFEPGEEYNLTLGGEPMVIFRIPFFGEHNG